MPAGDTPNPTYEEVCSGYTGHNEVVRVVYDPRRYPTSTLLETFWESHDPTQGMRQGNDVGTQYRSGIYVYDAEQRAAAERAAISTQKLEEGGPRRDHHRDPRCAGVLLCRGLSPAVSGKESEWLLRAGGLRDFVCSAEVEGGEKA